MARRIDRRTFVGGLAGAASLSASSRPVRTQTARRNARLFVADDDPGQAIPADFIGLSYESTILSEVDYFSPDNTSVLGLIGALGRNGVIRIGGNTSARTVWRDGPGSAEPGDIVITPRAIDRLAAALRILGWRLVYGLNLAGGTPQAAAEEAAYVARAMGPQLLAFQIGNEPDGFGRWARVRLAGYDVAAFLAEWRRFHAAIRERVQTARFAGPDVAAATDWLAPFAAAAPEGLVCLTCHYYADGPAGDPRVSLARLLQSSAQAESLLQELRNVGRRYGLPYRIIEANSVFNEGQPGVSDTFGASLWGLEFLLRCASAGCAGVNFHAGRHNLHPERDKAYTPIARDADGRYRPTPLYYAMRMFAQAASGSLVPVESKAGCDALATFAMRAADGDLQVYLVNKEADCAVRATIESTHDFSSASVLRLAAPAIDATTGVTLGRATVDDIGRWAPAARETAEIRQREVVVDVAAASAALVSLRP
jgi:hypothetical protein